MASCMRDRMIRYFSLAERTVFLPGGAARPRHGGRRLARAGANARLGPRLLAVAARDANSGGPGGPPGTLGLAIA